MFSFPVWHWGAGTATAGVSGSASPPGVEGLNFCWRSLHPPSPCPPWLWGHRAGSASSARLEGVGGSSSCPSTWAQGWGGRRTPPRGCSGCAGAWCKNRMWERGLGASCWNPAWKRGVGIWCGSAVRERARCGNVVRERCAAARCSGTVAGTWCGNTFGSMLQESGAGSRCGSAVQERGAGTRCGNMVQEYGVGMRCRNMVLEHGVGVQYRNLMQERGVGALCGSVVQGTWCGRPAPLGEQQEEAVLGTEL